ncbi:hypothetical protein DWUX_917 [Desulfovibrio diazotrophicus]|nr:hypothetical protein DWUX_917 [Desulfovibrio diazotrophicus]
MRFCLHGRRLLAQPPGHFKVAMPERNRPVVQTYRAPPQDPEQRAKMQ